MSQIQYDYTRQARLLAELVEDLKLAVRKADSLKGYDRVHGMEPSDEYRDICVTVGSALANARALLNAVDVMAEMQCKSTVN